MNTIRTPEPFWRETGPKAPWGPFDPDAKLHFSFDLSPWVEAAGTALSLQGCDVSADPALSVESAIEGLTVTAKVRAVTPGALVAGSLLAFTLKMKLSDGQQDDRTFYLLVRHR